MERTLVLLKPDCVQRRMMAEVIGRFERKGLNIIAMKMLHVTPELAKRHYAEHAAKDWYPELEKFITASPIVAVVVEGLEAIRVVRDLVGATNGRNAAPGTIRGGFGMSRQMKLVHASDGPKRPSANRRFSLPPTKSLPTNRRSVCGVKRPTSSGRRRIF